MVNAVRFLLAVGTRDLFPEYLTQAPLPPCDSIRLGRLMGLGLNFLFFATHITLLNFALLSLWVPFQIGSLLIEKIKCSLTCTKLNL